MASLQLQNPEPPVSEWADSVVRRGLAMPVSVGLELIRPISFAVAQLLLIADPLARPLWGAMGKQWSWLLEDRSRVDHFLAALSSQRPSPRS